MCLNFKIYTPPKIVRKLLKLCNYGGKEILKKHVVDNSCGDGAILEQVVLEYIKIANKQNFTRQQIKNDLEQYIHGFDIDEASVKLCKQNLQIIAQKNNLAEIYWDIKVDDYLNYNSCIKYDYIIGNPPYISYKDMKKEKRIELKRFCSCIKGKYDYYYAFIEKAFTDLNENGQMTYIVPNSFLKNKSGKTLRRIIKEFVTDIIDFSGEKIFKDALVSTCIIKLKNKKSKVLNYYIPLKGTRKKISKDLITDKYINEYNEQQINRLKFGDFYNVFSSVATLLNEAFLIDENEKDINFNEEVIRDAAGPKILSKNKKKYIIFPYNYVNNELNYYDEFTFKTQFPSSYNHLTKYKKRLENRAKDKKTKFYEYGRTQALTKLNQEKLLVSSLITKKVYVYKLDQKTIPYSGLVITAKTKKYTLDYAKSILESDEFLNYIENIAVSANGVTKRVSSKDIIEFDLGDFE